MERGLDRGGVLQKQQQGLISILSTDKNRIYSKEPWGKTVSIWWALNNVNCNYDRLSGTPRG
jgi:hypothetical protein